MTAANLMNVPSVKGNVPVQTDASKKLQEESLEVAEFFAGLMNQAIDLPNSVVDDTSSNKDVSKTDSIQSPNQSYERYSYKENQIETVQESSIEEKLEESGEMLEEAGEEVIDTLCKEYGVDEETIQKLLDDMGLSALDLLNPQNLVNFIVQLTGVASGEELLLDENFLSVMETLDHLAEGLMKELDVDMNGLQELVAKMELVTHDIEVPDDFQEVIDNTLNNVPETQPAEETTVEQVTDEDAKMQSAEVNETQNVESEMKESIVSEEVEDEVKNDVEIKEESSETKTKVEDSEESITGQSKEEGKEFANNQNLEGNSLLNHNANETVFSTQTTTNMSQIFEGQSVQQFSSYLSADSVQIMEQIVQQMRVTISSEVTTMEMQMNPENLGKVYVNISSEEGVVNAQFHATNEVVKEALEAQVATLRESLNQAGVKVDAIEVTIASHEFERNLEQNHQNPEEQMHTQEETKKRRNLNLDSLDELAGMMTEEEALVAQIMKDNGNSVDFTA